MSQSGGTTAGGGGGGSVCLDSGEEKTKATTLQGETGQGEGKGEDAPISENKILTMRTLKDGQGENGIDRALHPRNQVRTDVIRWR